MVSFDLFRTIPSIFITVSKGIFSSSTNLLFIDLRDNYGITQCVIDNKISNFKELE